MIPYTPIEVPVPRTGADRDRDRGGPESLVVRTQPRARPENEGKYIQREHAPEPMSRVFELPQEIHTDNIRAPLDNGILRMRVPKAAVGRRRAIHNAEGE